VKLFQTAIVLVLVMGLVLGTALPVSAKRNTITDQPQVSVQPDKGRGPWADGRVEVIRGEVESIGSDNLTVDGKLIIIVSGETRYKVPGLGEEATLSDIEVGMQIEALCYEKEGKFYARQITIISSRWSYGHHVGEVVAYYAGDNITIEDKWGNIVTFELSENFRILPEGAEINIGDQVTVITRGQPLTGDRVAVGVVVQERRPWGAWGGFASVSGNITAMNSENITIDTTVIKYDAETVFLLRGVSGASIGTDYGFLLTGEPATVFYGEQDNIKLAKLVLVGINLPEAFKEIGKNKERNNDKFPGGQATRYNAHNGTLVPNVYSWQEKTQAGSPKALLKAAKST
jgi:hypothetical protein